MLLAVAVVLVSVFFVATGWGGEMSYERPDHAPLDLGPVTATDIALMRPPTALWGYNMQVTDEALELIARAMRDRDVTIAALQQQLAELGPQPTQPLVPRQAPDTAESVPPADVRLPPYLRQPPETHHTFRPGQPQEPGPFADVISSFPEPPDRPDPESTHQAGPGERPDAPPTAPSSPAPGAPPTAPSSPAPDAPHPMGSPQSPGVSPTIQPPQAADVPPAIEYPQPPEPAPAAESPQPPEPAPAAGSPQPADVRHTRNFLRATSSKAPSSPQVPEAQTVPVPEARAPKTTPNPQVAQVTPPLSAPPVIEAGPQGSYDAHNWWAEQRAAREEQADNPASDVDPPAEGNGSAPPGPPDDEALAAAEEQGW
jgi:hypothetical protein